MDFLQRFGKGRAHSRRMPRGEARHLFVCSFWQSMAGGHCPPHAPRDFLHGGRAHKSAVQWLLCAYGLFAALWQGSGQFPPQCPGGEARHLFVCSFWRSLAGGRCPPHAPRDFLPGGRAHGGAVRRLCVRMPYCRASARCRSIPAAMPPGDSRTAVPFCVGCPPHAGAQKNTVSRQLRDTAF